MDYSKVTENASNYNDNTREVLSYDPVKLTTNGTYCCFDALAAACYAASTYGAGVLPAAGSVVPAGGLVNLARDVAPDISAVMARGAITAVPLVVGQAPVFDGHGWVFNPSASPVQGPFVIEQAGMASNRVCEPAQEGFQNFLDIVWFKLAAANAGSIFGAGQAGGSTTTAGLAYNSGGIFLLEPGDNGFFTPALNTVYQVAVSVSFNQTAGTSSLSAFVNGVLTQTFAGPAPSAFAANNANALALIGAIHYGGGFTGTIYRFEREFPGIPGLAPATIVANNYVANTGRFS